MTTSLHYWDESADSGSENAEIDAKSDAQNRSEYDTNILYAALIFIEQRIVFMIHVIIISYFIVAMELLEKASKYKRGK